MSGKQRSHGLSRRLFLGGTVAAGLVATGIPAAAADTSKKSGRHATPTLSTTDRLADRRYVTTGNRAYVVGDESGRFPAMGWHITGEMGGVWSPPLKLLDGIWFGIDGDWLGPAERFTSAYGHVRMDLPDHDGLSVIRTDFVPDDRRGALFGLTLETGSQSRTVTLTVDARSELTSAFPWGWTTPSQTDFNLEDEATFDGSRLLFRDHGKPDVEHASAHDWNAVVGAALDPVSHDVGDGFWGPQAPVDFCPPDGEGSSSSPPRCDDSKFGNGRGGRLQYEITVPSNATRTVWIGVAGSESTPEAATEELDAMLDDPSGALREKVTHRLSVGRRTRIDLPGDRLLERSVEWSKQNLADCVQEAHDLTVRYTDEGKQYPEPAGTVDEIRFFGAGFPDYPWMFGTDGEYTTFPALAAGEFDVAKDHMRSLKAVSRIVNGDTGKVVHETVTTGDVYFGANQDSGNTDETVKFPMAVDLIWRWTGDDAFRDELYPFMVDGMHYVVQDLDEDGDLWPTGSGNVERKGMGREKLDVAVYTIRGLYALADMARSKGDDETASWATDHAGKMLGKFEATWWLPEIPQHAGSIDVPGNGMNDNRPIYERHWIGVTPMSAEYVDETGEIVPGMTTKEHGTSALGLRETPCYGGIGDAAGTTQRRNEGLYAAGAPGCDGGTGKYTRDATEKQIFTHPTGIMAIGEGNYGRLGGEQQRRFIHANASLQLPDPDEQPGAVPEVAPSPAYGRSIDLQFTKRAQVLQAWGTLAILWPVVRQYLGVRPDIGRGRARVVPQIPPDQPRVAGERIRIGEDGALAVEAMAPGRSGLYRTRVEVDGDLDELSIGHTLPHGAEVASVTLNGESIEDYDVRTTNRGTEVSVDGSSGESNVLVVRTNRRAHSPGCGGRY